MATEDIEYGLNVTPIDDNVIVSDVKVNNDIIEAVVVGVRVN